MRLVLEELTIDLTKKDIFGFFYNKLLTHVHIYVKEIYFMEILNHQHFIQMRMDALNYVNVVCSKMDLMDIKK